MLNHNFRGMKKVEDGYVFNYAKQDAGQMFQRSMQEFIGKDQAIALPDEAIYNFQSMGMGDKIRQSNGVTFMFATDFYVGLTELLDSKVLIPRIKYSYLKQVFNRDIPYELDYTSYAALAIGGGADVGNGIPWIGSNAGQLRKVDSSLDKTASPVREIGLALSYTQRELAQAQRLPMGIDDQRTTAMNMKFQQAFDQAAFIGDSTVGLSGMLNNSGQVTQTTIQALGGTGNWSASTNVNVILQDINLAIQYMYNSSGQVFLPDSLLMPSSKLTYLFPPITVGGGTTVTPIAATGWDWLKRQSFAALEGGELNIGTNKWISSIALGAGGTQRMVLYVKNEDLLRNNIAPIRAFPTVYDGLEITRPYAGAIGSVEFLYPNSILYIDGI